MNLRKAVDISSANLSEQRYFPWGEFKVQIHSNDHNPPHFHVKSASEGYDVKLLIESGDLYKVNRYGKRKRRDRFTDVVALAKKWLPLEPADPSVKAIGSNQKYLAILWEANHQ